MKPYVLRRLKGMSDPLPTVKPKLFSTKGYMSDLDSMIKTEYVAQIDQTSNPREAMVKMLVDLELIQRKA